MPVAHLFGCRVRSDRALWPSAHAAGAAEPDPRTGAAFAMEIVELPNQPLAPIADERPGPVVELGRDVAFLRWPGVGACRVFGAVRIEATPVPGADPARFASLLRALAFPVALAQLGRSLLHGSVLRMGDAAVAILGPSGAGKSTLAYALGQRGHALVSDGIAVLEPTPPDAEGRPQFVAWPGPATFRLWPDTIAHLGGDPGEFDQAFPGSDKRAVPARVDGRPVRLGRCYVLVDGDHERVAPLVPAAAAVALTQQSFLAGQVVGEARAQLLESAAAISRALPVLRLERRQELARLPALLELLEADAASAAARPLRDATAG